MLAYATAETRMGMENAHKEYLIGAAVGAVALLLVVLDMLSPLSVNPVFFSCAESVLLIVSLVMILHGIHRFMLFVEHGSYAALQRPDHVTSEEPARASTDSGAQ